MIRLSLATGLSEANITGMQWSQINMDKWIAWFHPNQAKSGKAIVIPLSNDAMVVLRE